MLLLLKDSHFSQMQNFYNAKIQKLAIKYWFEKKNKFFSWKFSCRLQTIITARHVGNIYDGTFCNFEFGRFLFLQQAEAATCNLIKQVLPCEYCETLRIPILKSICERLFLKKFHQECLKGHKYFSNSNSYWAVNFI